MKKMLKTLLLMLALMMLMVACGPKKTENEGSTETSTSDSEQPAADGSKYVSEDNILRTNNSSEPGSLDPAKAQGTHESWILNHSFEGLMKRNAKGELVEGMAEKMEVSEDGITYTFTLKDGLKWSNGDPVTAHDFEYSWKRVVNPEVASDYAFQMFYIAGAEDALEGKGSPDDMAVKALDDKTLEVKLKSPVPYFPEMTAFYTYYPVNKKVVESNPDWAKDVETLVSNGPFKITEWKHKEKVILMKNDNYYDADAVKLAGIEFDILDDQNTAYQKFDADEYALLADVPTTVVAKMQEDKDPVLHIGNQVGTYYYNFNGTDKVFSNPKVRKAFSMALDRKVIVEKITQGGQLPAEGVVPYGLPDAENKEFREINGNLIKEDPAKAKEMLEEGLQELGMTLDDVQGKTLLYNTSESHKKIAQAVQQMWKQNLGVDVNLENVEFQVKLDREKVQDFDISRAGWIGDYADPMTMMDLWYSTSSFNDAKYNNPKYDKLIEEAKASNDNALRFEKMAEAEKMLMDDMPIIPVYFYTQPYLVKSNVKGVYKTLLTYPIMTYAEIEK